MTQIENAAIALAKKDFDSTQSYARDGSPEIPPEQLFRQIAILTLAECAQLRVACINAGDVELARTAYVDAYRALIAATRRPNPMVPIPKGAN